jgi:large conductance mechanosensitive channel
LDSSKQKEWEVKKLIQEFKDFAFSGDILGLAVAFVMAAAFGAVVNALVEFVVMPIVGIIFGEPSFDFLSWTINDSVILYGSFITAIVKFLAVALGVFFFIIKPYQAYQASKAVEEEEAPAEPSEDIKLLTEIRDALAR